MVIPPPIIESMPTITGKPIFNTFMRSLLTFCYITHLSLWWLIDVIFIQIECKNVWKCQNYMYIFPFMYRVQHNSDFHTHLTLRTQFRYFQIYLRSLLERVGCDIWRKIQSRYPMLQMCVISRLERVFSSLWKTWSNVVAFVIYGKKFFWIVMMPF